MKFIATIGSLLALSVAVDKEAYYAALQEIDFDDVKADLTELMTNSQDYWPADSGNYAGLMVRLAWHCAGSYRRFDGEGGCDGGRMRFLPEQAWADNTNLDKARNLLEPIKGKYGVGLSYGDLYILAGNVAIESTGGKILGFCAGRVDDDDGAESLVLGPSDIHDEVNACPAEENGECKAPKGATTNELIYVNPGGVHGNGDPNSSINPIIDTFGRMGMNPREAVALIGAHTLGKTHGACPNGAGPSPREDPVNPWPGNCENGIGENTFTSGFEGPWTVNPNAFDNSYFRMLTSYEWEPETSPAGNPQFKPNVTEGAIGETRMLVADVALKYGEELSPYVYLYADDNTLFLEDFAAAWYKLTTRDMGPRSRCFGADVPPVQEFQGEELDTSLVVSASDWDKLDVVSKLNETEMVFAVEAAFRCAATYRVTDNFGGCNGARFLLEPERSWEVNGQLASFTEENILEGSFEGSKADQIVFAGMAALESIAETDLQFVFCPGRKDAENGNVSENLEMYQFESSLVQISREVRLMDVGVSGYVALAGRPRSAAYMKSLGYTGSYEGAENLDNMFYTLLYEEALDWQATGVTGVLGDEYVDSNGTNFITGRDYALLLRPEFRAAVITFSFDNNAFLQEFTSSWTKLMNADRYSGPVGNVCEDGLVPLVSVAGGNGNDNQTEKIVAIVACVTFFLVALLLGIFMTRENKDSGKN
eukprot:maker-scaffold_1-snap-gene-17.3-mRNA-1 protein AED:0.01 eAED:0.01 QI:45/1/1/1/1/1/3/75/707